MNPYRLMAELKHFYWQFEALFTTTLLYWHPVTRQWYYKYYYKRGTAETLVMKEGKSDFKLLEELGGGKWAKVDYCLAYVRSGLITVLFFAIFLVYGVGIRLW